MLLKIAFPFFTLLISSLVLTAQNKYEIGIEGGLTYNHYKINDVGQNLKPVRSESAIAGVTLRVNTKSRFFYEFAFLACQYTNGLKLKQQSGFMVSNSDDVLMMPLRAGYIVKLSKRLSISPIVGITPVIKTLNQDGSSGSYTESNARGVYMYEYTRREIWKDFFLLTQGGLSIDYATFKRLKFGFGTSYYQGIITHAIYDVNYRLNNEPMRSAVMTSKGSFLNYSLNFKYTFPKRVNFPE